MRALSILLLASACGRVDFDLLAAPGDGAPSSDATSGDGTSAFCSGQATACPSGATFCEDFETSSAATFPNWDLVRLANWNTAGAADPSTSMTATGAPCRGNRSALGHTLGEAQVAFLYKALSSRPNPLYARMWFRIGPSSSDLDFELFGLHDTPNNTFINIGLDRSAASIGVNVVGFTSSAASGAPATVAIDRWTCFELGILFDSATGGSLSVKIDGTTLLDKMNVTTEGSAPLDRIAIGVISQLGETGTFDVAFDDLVISGTPIGCN